jgi:hypothetical protein
MMDEHWRRYLFIHLAGEMLLVTVFRNVILPQQSIGAENPRAGPPSASDTKPIQEWQ